MLYDIRLTNTVEEGLFLALTRAAVPIHRVHIITFLPFGTKTAGGITQKTSTHTHTLQSWLTLKHILNQDLSFRKMPYFTFTVIVRAWFFTSGCVHPHSSGPPVHVPMPGRARSRCGQRWFGPGRWTRHVARHPCTERGENDISPSVLGQCEALKKSFVHWEKRHRSNQWRRDR